MFSRTLLLAFVALFASLAVVYAADSTPPACFLACVNEEPTVSDYKAVCSSKAMSPCLESHCNSAVLKEAQESFTTSCKAKGYTALITDSKPSASATKSGSAYPTASAGSGSNSTSSSGSSVDDADSGASFATASLGIVGAFSVGVLAMLL